MLPAAYAESMAIWAYPVMASVLVGTLLESGLYHGRR
jgi:hypothetical protein